MTSRADARRSNLILALTFASGALAVGCSTSDGGGGSGGSTATGGSGGRGGSSGRGGATAGSGPAGGSTAGAGGSSAGSGGASAGSGGAGGSGGSAGSGGSGGGVGGSASDGPRAETAGGASGAGGSGIPAAGFPGWKFVKNVKMDTTAAGAAVMGDVDSYPVAVTLTATNFDFTQAKDDGSDLRFGKEDGTPLVHALEHWDKAGQTAAAWVKVDKVAGNNATQSINMYWGNTTATDASDSKKVFDTTQGFIGVWHLNDPGSTTAGGYKDATGNEAHGTGVGFTAASSVAGRIGKATDIANELNSWVRVDGPKLPLFDTANKMTISIWFRANRLVGRAPIGYDTVFSKGDSAWTIQRLGRGSTMETCVRPGGHACAIGKVPIMTGETAPWFHVTAVLDHPNLRFYVNGAADGTTSAGGEWRKGAHPVGIGVQSQYAATEPRFWDGPVDEARVMGVAKDANWIKLEFESQKEGSKFLVFGATQMR